MDWVGANSEVVSSVEALSLKSPRASSIEITYTVRLSDLAWMYLGSWAARLAALPGLSLMAAWVMGWPPPADIPVATYFAFLGISIVTAAAGPLLLLPMLFMMNGTLKVVGTTVHLSVDNDGLSGWPLAPEIERTWPRIRHARRLHGVITLPFRQFGTRAGWVPMPERAMTSEQLVSIRALLASKGLMKAAKSAP